MDSQIIKTIKEVDKEIDNNLLENFKEFIPVFFTFLILSLIFISKLYFLNIESSYFDGLFLLFSSIYLSFLLKKALNRREKINEKLLKKFKMKERTKSEKLNALMSILKKSSDEELIYIYNGNLEFSFPIREAASEIMDQRFKDKLGIDYNETVDLTIVYRKVMMANNVKQNKVIIKNE